MARNDDIVLDTTTIDEENQKSDSADGESAPVRDPNLDPNASGLHDGLDPTVLERNTVFNPTAPAGQSVEGGLSSLTNIDGSAFKAGPDHHGVAEFDALLEGHSPGNSPLDVRRDPTDPAAMPKPPQQGGTIDSGGSSGGGSTISESKSGDGLFGAGPPPGVNMSGTSNASHNMDLVGQTAGGGGMKLRDGDKNPPKHDNNPNPNDGGGKVDPNLGTYGATKEAAPVTEKGVIDTVVDAVKDFTGIGTKKDTNPDADTNVAPTQEQLDRAVAFRGAATHTVDGVGAGPQIEGGPPPEGGRNPLVTDPSGEGDELGATSTTPIINTAQPDIINPHDILAPPVIPGGGTQGGNTGQQGEAGDHPVSGSQADTATYVEPSASDPTGVTEVGGGTGSSSIHSVDPAEAATATADTVDAGFNPDVVSGLRDPSIMPIDHADVVSGVRPIGDDAVSGVRDTSVRPVGDDAVSGVRDTSVRPIADHGDSSGDASADPVDTFANEFLADGPDGAAIIIPDVGIIIPETDQIADAFPAVAPIEHTSFVDADIDLAPAPQATEDLFGNDESLG